MHQGLVASPTRNARCTTCYSGYFFMPLYIVAEPCKENGLSEEDGENNNRSDDPSAYHRADEQVNLYLESTSLKNMKRQYLR